VKHFLGPVLGLVSGLVLGTPPAAAAPPPTPLKLAFALTNAVYWDIDAALDEGFFLDAGFAPALIAGQSSPEVVQLLLSGDVQFGAVQTEPLMSAVSRGATDVAIIAQPEARPDWLLVASPDIKTWSDMKGKTLGVSALRVSEFWLAQRLFMEHGLAKNSWNTIQVGISPLKFAALQKGSIAAAVLFQPLAQRAVRHGFVKLADFSALGAYPPIVYTLNRKWAATGSNGVRLGKVLARAHAWLADPKNRAAAIAVLVKHTKCSPEVAAELYPLFFGSGQIYTKTGGVDTAGVDRVIGLMVENGELPKGGAPTATQYLLPIAEGGLRP
jgi:ABC-type nitrate/sulfonate/bicarbonate transport system substrate-binding protein